MKKLISFLLVIMMLCSMSVSAFASGANLPADKNADIGYGAKTDEYDSTDTNPGTPDVSTELWLQVAAEGQIDVTVPLVIVFKTNIDGGNATEATNYKIINNNNAPVVVTGIGIVEETTTGPNNASNPMELVPYSYTNSKYVFTADDQYMVKLYPQIDGNDGYDLGNTISSVAASQGGLFALKTADRVTDTNGTDTIITVEMATSPLSFVTITKTENGKEILNPAMGVKLLTVTYTVGVNTNTAIGTAINDTITFPTAGDSGDVSNP